MKGRLYKSVKSREEIESSQLFNTMLQKVEGTNSVVIDGKNLMAGSIVAKHIKANEITTDHLQVGVATADLIETGGLNITSELKITHGNKDVLFINSEGALEMNVSALKIGLVDFERDINTEIKAIAGSWSQMNLNSEGDIISGINANAKGTNIHGKNISLTGDTDVQGDFRVAGGQVILNANTDVRGDFTVSGGNVILNANTDVRGDFKVSGGNVVLDANTDIRGDFTVSGNKVVLDAETTVLDTFTVKGDMLASNLDVEQLTIRAKNGLQNVLHIDRTGRVELNVDAFHIKALDVEEEINKRATKEELANIELTPGPPGPQGQATYTHVGYATGPNGENFSTKSFTDATHIGIYVSTSQDLPTPVTKYEWTLIKGRDGNNGAPGPVGPQGDRTYLHTAWTNDPNNTNNAASGFSRTESEGKLYIGTYTNTEEESANNPGPYNWVKVKGEKGDRGPAGRSIEDVIIEYAVSNSPTQEPPQSSFSPNTPSWSSGQFIWSQTRTKYQDSSPDTVSKAAVITGGEGPQGPQGGTGSKGDEGRSVSLIQQEYAINRSKYTAPSSGSFSINRGNWSTGMYVWTRSRIVYQNPHGVQYTTPVVSSEWEAVNDVDAKLNNAVTTIDGQGITVKDGSFFLEDEDTDTKYSIVSGTNLISDHSFELHEFDVVNNSLVFGTHGTVKAKRNIDPTLQWETVGNPYFFTGRNSNLQAIPPMFGLTAAYINSSNYFRQAIPITDRNISITVSSYFRKFIDDFAPTPVITVRGRVSASDQGGYQRWTSSENIRTFPRLSESNKNVRHSMTVDLRNIFSQSDIDTGLAFLYISVRAGSVRRIMADGVQVVEGQYPVHYDPEDSLFKFMAGVTGSKAGHIRAGTGTFDNILVTGDYEVKDGLTSHRIPAHSDLNDFTQVGFYYNSANRDAQTIYNVPEPLAFSLLVEWHAGFKQTFSTFSSTEVRTYVRNHYGGNWGPWQSDSAVIGSNSYGTYIKHADGLLEQFGRWDVSGGVTAYNNTFYTDFRDFYFPMSFVTVPDFVQVTPYDNYMMSASVYERQRDRVPRVIVYASSSRAINGTLMFYTVGRWK